MDAALLAIRLTACPVCRGQVEPTAAQCAACGTELSPYREQVARATSLLAEGYNAVSRGDGRAANELALRALMETPLAAVQAEELQIRALLLEHDYTRAWERTQALPADLPVRTELLEEIAALHELEAKGKQHFNLALASARAGLWVDASFHCERALDLAPHLEAAWRLAVKVELKRGRYEVARMRLLEGQRRFPREPFLAQLARDLA